jgi:type VI secretion system protein VasJ
MDLLSLGKDPISPDQPTGSDVSYETEFDELETEIRKLSLPPSSGGGIDWKKIGDLSALILAEQSKDLRAAGYFAVSQVHTNQIEGLTIGITVLHDMIENFWDELFPPKKRMQRRLGAIKWWLEKSENAIEWWLEKPKNDIKATKFEPAQNEKIEELKSILNKLNNLIIEYLPNPPTFKSLIRQIERIPVVDKNEQPESAAKENKTPAISINEIEKKETGSKQEDPPMKTPDPPSFSGEIADENNAKILSNDSLKILGQIADFWFKTDSRNPKSYRFRRTAAWLAFDRLPAETNGITLISSPPVYQTQMLNSVSEKKDWQELLKAAEPMVSQQIFWIDLHRMVAEALSNLGDNHQDALDAVCQETALFVHRMPGLLDLSFAEETPFADPETRQWLKSIALGTSAAMFEPIQITESNGEDKADRMEDTIKKAMALVEKKKIVEAVSSLQEELQSAFSKKEAMLWRLALCQILLSSKKVNMALPHFEVILEIIENYKLEDWDPELALKGFKMVWQGYSAHSDKAVKQQSEQILSRIGKIHPVEALRLAK